MTTPNYTGYQLIRLNILRRKLNRVGEQKGLLHPMTLALSRRVDELVVEIMEEEREGRERFADNAKDD